MSYCYSPRSTNKLWKSDVDLEPFCSCGTSRTSNRAHNFYRPFPNGICLNGNAVALSNVFKVRGATRSNLSCKIVIIISEYEDETVHSSFPSRCCDASNDGKQNHLSQLLHRYPECPFELPPRPMNLYGRNLRWRSRVWYHKA
jgi:hypothetical protein